MNVLKQNKKEIPALFFIFLLLLLCNLLTEKLVDDFAYMCSWATGERITNIMQIFPSMMSHSKIMNGRFVAHFLVQIFEMLPKKIFDVVNAGMFTFLIFWIYRFARTEKNNVLLLLGIFGAVWIFTPSFGEVFLWLDGSCNYSWGMVFGLLFLTPYIRLFLYDKRIKGVWRKILFLLLSLMAGAFSETGSAAFLWMAGLLVLAVIFLNHKKIPVFHMISIAVAFCGYLTIYLSPAEMRNKPAERTLVTVRNNFIHSLKMYEELKILLIAFVILFIILWTKKIYKERLILAAVLLSGSLCSNFLMVFAQYYPGRSLLFSTIFLLAADALLLAPVLEGTYKTLAACAVSVLLLFTAFSIPVAVNDIYSSNAQIRSNDQYVYECKEQGIKDIVLPMISSETPYSVVYGLKYLDTTSPDIWPNDWLANYYGVDSLLGVW